MKNYYVPADFKEAIRNSIRPNGQRDRLRDDISPSGSAPDVTYRVCRLLWKTPEMVAELRDLHLRPRDIVKLHAARSVLPPVPGNMVVGIHSPLNPSEKEALPWMSGEKTGAMERLSRGARIFETRALVVPSPRAPWTIYAINKHACPNSRLRTIGIWRFPTLCETEFRIAGATRLDRSPCNRISK